jgi:hypothetical protein
MLELAGRLYRASGRSRRTRYAPSYWLCLLANSSLTARSGKLMIKIEADEGISVALLVSMISLVGCAGPGELLFKNSIVVDHLDGNYQILARCTYEHLARQQTQLSVTDLREQETVRIALKSPQTYWELSFVNEDGGRQTRLEATSGSFSSEHTLALARACAA